MVARKASARKAAPKKAAPRKATAKKAAPKGVAHSAITGRIVKASTARRHPDTTFVVPRKAPKK